LPIAVSGPAYNANHQLVSWGGATLTYDQNGNLTHDGVRSYTWNARDQLTGLSGPGLAASFAYDAFGRRTSKTVNGTTTGYLHDGDEPLLELAGPTPTATLLPGLG
jgi:YD repeat-containing protein